MTERAKWIQGISKTASLCEINLNGEVNLAESVAVSERDLADVRTGVWKGQKVAVKLLKVLDEDGRDTIVSVGEIKLWTQLRHEHLLRVIGVTTEVFDSISLITPWMEFRDAGSFLKAYPSIHPGTLLHQVASGVRYLHEQVPPIVHGDLKASNILITPHGYAKVADYGLLRLLGRCISAETASEVDIAPTWISPELCVENSKPSPKSDMFAFGLLIYELFTCHRPSDELPSREQILKAVSNNLLAGIYPLTDIPHLSDRWFTLTLSCLNETPSSRPDIVPTLVQIRRILLESTMVTTIADLLDNSSTKGFGASHLHYFSTIGGTGIACNTLKDRRILFNLIDLLKSADIVAQSSAIDCMWTFSHASGLPVDEFRKVAIQYGCIGSLARLLQEPETGTRAMVCLSKLSGLPETYIAVLQTMSIQNSRELAKKEYKTSRISNWETKYQTVKHKAAVVYTITVRLVTALDTKDPNNRAATLESLRSDLDSGEVRISILLSKIIPELVDAVDEVQHSEAALECNCYLMQYPDLCSAIIENGFIAKFRALIARNRLRPHVVFNLAKVAQYADVRDLVVSAGVIPILMEGLSNPDACEAALNCVPTLMAYDDFRSSVLLSGFVDKFVPLFKTSGMGVFKHSTTHVTAITCLSKILKHDDVRYALLETDLQARLEKIMKRGTPKVKEMVGLCVTELRKYDSTSTFNASESLQSLSSDSWASSGS